MGIQERKEREKERRRQQIIVAAKRVFSEKGFNKATMEDIAKEAELSPGTLYLYFKNKEELYASLSLRILQYLHIRVSHVINQDGYLALCVTDQHHRGHLIGLLPLFMDQSKVYVQLVSN